jgi:hypothetical protein
VAELVHDSEGWRWFVDTPEVRVEVPGAQTAVAVAADGRETPVDSDGSGWAYPEHAVLMRAR